MTKNHLYGLHGWLLEKIAESSANTNQKAILETWLNISKKQFEMGLLDSEGFSRVLAQIEDEVRANPAPDLLTAIQDKHLAMEMSVHHQYESIGLLVESIKALQQRVGSLEKRVLEQELRH